MSLSSTLVKWVRRVAPGVWSGAGAAGHAPALGRNELRRRVVGVLQPLLKPHGFGRFESNNARRRGAEWLDVVNIRFDRDADTHGYALVIEAGRYFAFVDNAVSYKAVASRDGQPWAQVVECHLRKRLFRQRRQPGNRNRNFWSIGPNGEWLDETLADIEELMAAEILPWFDWLDDLPRVLDLALQNVSDTEGNSRDPMLRGMYGVGNCFREVFAAFVAFRLDRWAQCIALAEPIVARGGVLGHRGSVLALNVPARARLHRLVADAGARLANAATT